MRLCSSSLSLHHHLTGKTEFTFRREPKVLWHFHKYKMGCHKTISHAPYRCRRPLSGPEEVRSEAGLRRSRPAESCPCTRSPPPCQGLQDAASAASSRKIDAERARRKASKRESGRPPRGVARGNGDLQLSSSSNSRKASSECRESDFRSSITKPLEARLALSCLRSLADQEVLIISIEKSLA